MEHVFTAYVEALDPGGTEPNSELFDAVWSALRKVLKSEMKRRGIWESPPSYLGVVGWQAWFSVAHAAHGPRRFADALAELVAECYVFVFVTRLRSLKAQLELKANVDGLVVLNVRHFLQERQRACDPLGFRVFESVQNAVRVAVDAGDLYVLSGNPKIRNDTVLGTAPWESAGQTPRAELAVIVARWIDGLLPELITARGKVRRQVVETLRGHFGRLADEGVGMFRFKDLSDPLKDHVRARWAAVFEQDQAGSGTVRTDSPKADPLFWPAATLEERQSFVKLTECVGDRLERRRMSGKTRKHLHKLWEFLRLWASEPPGQRPGTPSQGGLPAGLPEGELPSHRKLAQLLRIPRERLPGLFATLAEVARECREATLVEGGRR